MFFVTMSHTLSRVLFLRLQLCYGFPELISTTWHSLLAIPEDQERISIQVDSKERTYQALRR